MYIRQVYACVGSCVCVLLCVCMRVCGGCVCDCGYILGG